MKLHIVGHNSSINSLVDRLTTQLNALFPEVGDNDFPIEFVAGGVYNGMRSDHEFTNEAYFREYCVGKSQIPKFS